MPIWTKISGVWKQIDRVYTKISGSWREVNPAKVKISNTWRITHELIPPFYYPSGAILPYWNTIGSLPSGWSHYTDCGINVMPIGVGTYSSGETFMSGYITLTSSTTSNHTGALRDKFWTCTGTGLGGWQNPLSPDGSHFHTVGLNPHSGLPYAAIPFIQATTDIYSHPAYGVVFGYGTNLGSHGLSIMNFGTTHYYLAGRGTFTTTTSNADQWISGISLDTSEYSGHHHGGTHCLAFSMSGTGVYSSMFDMGGHLHTVDIYATNYPRYALLGAWWTTTTTPNVGGYGTMVMYPSATAPARWSICNGTNGTPNMNDRFARIHSDGGYGGSSGGSFNPVFTGTTNAAGAHHHANFTENWGNNTSQGYHSDLQGNEVHTFYDDREWKPALRGTYWIMYTG
jgi:hypothetical protein